MKTLNIGQTFSKHPAGRFYSDKTGASGEQFREELLWPAIEKLGDGESLEIVMDDGTQGYGSSFLTEGFAGIVKYGYLDAETLLAKLNFTYTNPDFRFFVDKAIQYIRDAKFASKKYVCTK